MKFKVIKAYIFKCKSNGSEPTFIGLNEYARKRNK
jgi:hypothetical protein